jgi:hypothetical protein
LTRWLSAKVQDYPEVSLICVWYCISYHSKIEYTSFSFIFHFAWFIIVITVYSIC